MNLNKILPIILVSGLATTLSVLADDDTNNIADTIKALKQQIEALDQKVRVLERRRELDQETSTNAAVEAMIRFTSKL